MIKIIDTLIRMILLLFFLFLKSNQITKNLGSLGAQCSEDGQCPCKPGVGTRTCSKCAPNFYDMTPQGCRFVNVTVHLNYIAN